MGRLTWESGKTVEKNLGASHDSAAYEAVQYLPQSFLETVCNEGPGSDELFARELGEVIFSHVPEADRLGTTTLDELTAERTSAAKRKIEILREELASTNAQIADLERQSAPAEKKRLAGELVEKQEELDAHDSGKPAKVPPPEEGVGDSASSDLEVKIAQVRADIVALERELEELQNEANEKSLLLEACTSLRKELDNFRHQHESFVSRISPTASRLGLAVDDLVRLEVRAAPLDHLSTALTEARAAAVAKLEVTADDTPAKALADASESVEELESALDAPRRRYQAYLTDLAAWEKQRRKIVGTASTPESLEYFKARLEELGEVPSRIDGLRTRRAEQVADIHHELLQISETLRAIYSPVQRFIDEHPVVRDRFRALRGEAGLAASY